MTTTDPATFGVVVDDDIPARPARDWRPLAVVLVAQMLFLVDLGSVVVAIPRIRDDLGAGVAEAQLLLAAYSLAFAVLLIPGGRLGDLLGRRRLLMTGLVVFLAASALSALAPNAPLLILARVLAGAAAALASPQVLAVIQVTVPIEERPRALGLFASASSMGMMIGQIGGGFLLRIDLFGLGWRAVMTVEIALAVLVLAAIARVVAETQAGNRQPLDLGGAAVLATGLAMIVGPLATAGATGWRWWVWLSLATAPVVLYGFVRHERAYATRVGPPLLDLSLFRIRAFAAGLTACFVFFASASPILLLVTLLAQEGLGLDPLTAGSIIAVAAGAFFLSSQVFAKWAARTGRAALVVGGAIGAVGIVLVSIPAFVVGGEVTVLQLVPGIFVLGVGQGVMMPLTLLFTLSEVDESEAGAAGGAFTAAQQVASALGIAGVGLVFSAFQGDGTAPDDYARAFGASMLSYVLVMTAAAVAVVPLLPRHPRSTVEAVPVVDVPV